VAKLQKSHSSAVIEVIDDDDDSMTVSRMTPLQDETVFSVLEGAQRKLLP